MKLDNKKWKWGWVGFRRITIWPKKIYDLRCKSEIVEYDCAKKLASSTKEDYAIIVPTQN